MFYSRLQPYEVHREFVKRAAIFAARLTNEAEGLYLTRKAIRCNRGTASKIYIGTTNSGCRAPTSAKNPLFAYSTVTDFAKFRG
ncbi:hypothetical protein [Microseira wollei]|uniref:Transposase n=1 Tax=Microseira wollei NIES-4236 TaxID=2530354 RepID=A0AAV3X4W5_9CYAN|nr:hypothetical protein [Microseira wollei]GET36226.1 hypothetical protein MiSe_09740 [Microseira wollei NIES-4236]